MKPTIRKIGDPIPVALLIMPDGELVLADGGDVKAYLKQVRRNSIKLGSTRKGKPMEIAAAERGFQEMLESHCILYKAHSA